MNIEQFYKAEKARFDRWYSCYLEMHKHDPNGYPASMDQSEWRFDFECYDEEDHRNEIGRIGECEMTTRDELLDLLRDIQDRVAWHCDTDGDDDNKSPEDMTAHVNGVIWRKIQRALDGGGGDK